MLHLILSIIVVFAQDYRVAVRADNIRHPESVAYALSWSLEDVPVLVSSGRTRAVRRIMRNKYCSRMIVRRKMGGFELNANSYNFLELNKFYKLGFAGRRVILSGVQAAPRVSILARMIGAQMQFKSDIGGRFDISIFQKSCKNGGL